MTGILNHLWQSSAFAAIIALAVWTLRHNSPRARYWLWLTASLKFLIPFWWIVSAAARLELPPNAPSLRVLPVTAISTYFAPVSMPVNPVPVETPFDWAVWLGLLWLGGAFFLVVRRCRQWQTLRRVVRRATPVSCACEIPMLSSNAGIEPGIFGLFHPVLVLPDGFADTLTPAQLNAILAHELRHVRCRDNLTAALHMCVETIFWFYPPVWWIGAKLMEERERDCDEAALAQGGSPGEYARSILQVCESYAGSQLACAAGISGADLKKRVCKIMTWRKSLPVKPCTKVGLALAAAGAFLVPFGVGIARGQNSGLPRQANGVQAPAQPATAHFEVASIKPQENVPETRDTVGIKVTPGRFHVGFAPVQGLIRYAWGIDPQTKIEGEAWERMRGRETQYVVDATFEPAATDAQVRQMLQALLAERFQLRLHLSSRDEAYLALEIASGGPKNLNTKPATAPPRAGSWGGCMASYPGCAPVTMALFSNSLSLLTHERIVDRTGLTGSYYITLWCQETVARFLGKEEAEAAFAPSIYSALPQQLGLRLVRAHGPVSTYVVDHIAAPTPN